MIKQLSDSNYDFPDLEYATEDGLLAFGGDLNPDRLINAYRQGVFPWFSEDDPILWWSPDPRFILIPSEIKISKSMKKILNQKKFQVTFNKSFLEVIKNCQKSPRKDQNGTWICNDMINAYKKLHELGFAHSVEVWQENELVGGLYGVSIGKCFFGESMFSKASNSSKVALIELAKSCMEKDFVLIDCQVYTKHLESMGALMINRNDFTSILKKNPNTKTIF